MDEEAYEAQLHEVFMTCDHDGDGFLTKDELLSLCHKLQLDEQASQIVNVLVPRGSSGHISFEQFKSGFVEVLSRVASATETDTSESDSESQTTRHLSTRGKRYGRRSRPDSEADTSYSDNDFDSYSDSKRSTSPAPSTAANQQWNMSLNSTRIEPGSYTSDDELAAAEERERLKAILEEVNVGQAGFLDVRELKTVCEHIGMENLNEEELSFLFEELDENKDGTLSFDEFLHGLSIVKELGAFANSPPISLPGTPPQTLRLPASLKRRTSINRLGAEEHISQTSRVPTPYSFNQTADLFSSLDPNHIGYVPADAVSDILAQEGLVNAQEIIQTFEMDADNKISIRQLSETLEQIILESSQDPPVTQAILSVYKSEVGFLRSTIEEHIAEKERLKNDLARAADDQTMLIRESEERSSDQDKTYQNLLKNTERECQSKIQTLQKEMEVEREKWNQQTAKQIQKMENSIGQQRYEEQNLKDKLADSEEEKNRLGTELAQTHSRLIDAQRNIVRLTRELESASELSSKLAEFDAQREDLNKQQSSYAQQELRELEQQNRELRDQVDELTTRCDKYQDQIAQLNNTFNRRGGPRSQGGGRGVGRVGSVLSDYAKPLIVKRRTQESDSDSESTSESSSGTESDVLKKLKKEREPSAAERQVESLKNDVEEWKEKYNSVKEAFTKEKIEILEKHDRETAKLRESFNSEIDSLKQLAGDRSRKSDEMQQLQNHIEELNQLINELNSKIEELENEIETLKKDSEELILSHKKELMQKRKAFENEKENLENEFDQERNQIIDSYAEEKESMEKRFEKEKKDLEDDYIQDKIQLEETHITEKAQLEEQKNQEKMDVIANYEKERLEMENRFARDKTRLKEQLDSEYQDTLESKMKELQNRFNNEKSVLEKSMNKDGKKIREEFEALFQKKREDLEQQHEDDLKKLSRVLADEKIKLDEEYQRQRDSWQLEKTQLENKFKQNMEEKLRLEREQHQSSELAKNQKELLDSINKEKLKFEQLLHEKETQWKKEMDELHQQLGQDKDELKKALQQEHRVEIQQLMEQYYRDKDDLEKAKNNAIQNQTQELQKMIDQLNLENKKLAQDNQNLKDEYQADKAEIMRVTHTERESLMNQCSQVQNELNRIKQENIELETKIALFEEKLALIGNSTEEGTKKLQEKIEEHYLEKANWEKSTRQLTERNKLLVDNIESLESTITEIEKSKEESLEKEQAKVSAYQMEVNQLSIQYKNSQSEIALIQEKVIKSEVTIQTLRKEIVEVTSQKQLLEKRLQHNESSMQHYTSAQEASQKEVDLLKNKLQSSESLLKESADKMEQVVIELNNEKRVHRLEVTQLSDKIQQKEREEKAQLDILQQELALIKNKLLDKETNFIQLKKEMESFAAGGYMQRQEFQHEIEKHLHEKNDLLHEKEELCRRLKETRDAMDNHISVMRAQIIEAENKTERNNILVSELYLENCKLSKQLYNSEQDRQKIEKDYYNISAQKGKLQNLLSSLCKATI